MPVETTNPRLGIPRAVVSRSFLEIATNLQESPILARHVKTWMIPGRKMDLAREARDPTFAVNVAHCTSLWLWPEPRDGQQQTNAGQFATLNVAIRLYVASVDPLDALDLYGAVEEALNPATVADGASLADRLGAITRWGGITLSQPAAISLESADGPIAVAEGAVEYRYKLPGFGGL